MGRGPRRLQHPVSIRRRLAGRVATRAPRLQLHDRGEFLARAKDRAGHGFYADAPWPDDGDGYTHTFTPAMQARLVGRPGEFRDSRVVIGLGDHPLIRELYPEGRWTWRRLNGRNNANGHVAECLVIKGASRAASLPPERVGM